MENRQEIQEELAAIAPSLLPLPRPVHPALPADYFLHFRQQLATERQLRQIAKPVAPDLPPAYFTRSRESIFSRVRQWEVAEELNQTAPALLAAREAATSAVTPLDTQKQRNKIWEKIKGTERRTQIEKAVPDLSWSEKLLAVLFPPQYTFAWSSASVALLLFLLWQFNPPAPAECASLACLSDQEIEQYIRSNADEFDEQLLNTSPDGKLRQQPDILPLNENDVKDYLRESYDESGLF